MLGPGLSRCGPAASRQARRALSSSTILRAAAPALADTAPASGGFLSKLFGGGSSGIGVPMTDPLPGVDPVVPVPVPAKAPTTETTTLANGVKVASEATLGPTATLGIYVDSGSVYETPQSTGVSHLLEYMAFKGTTHRTHFRLVREVEVIGGNVLSSASREQMAYNIDIVKTNVPEALEMLADAVLNPKFAPWEVSEAVERLKADTKGLKENPQTVLLEGMHTVAYTGGLGRPLICPEGAADHLTPEVLEHFVRENYTAPRIVLAGAGMAHKELLSLAEPLMSAAPRGSPAAPPRSQYVGGDFRQPSNAPLTHAMLGFEFAGGWRDLKGSVAVTVLQFLLGGGGSFSAGGPGKGMHSRLYKRVLNQHAWMHNCTAFNSLYNETGIVGVFASAENAQAEKMIDVLVRELQAVTKEVPAEELARAKAAATSSILMNLESRGVVAEDIGRQILTYGHRKPVSEFVSAIQALSASDLAAVARKLLSSPLAMAVQGDLAHVPRYDAVAKRF